MSNLTICTRESMLAGAMQLDDALCMICLRRGPMEVGYIDARCWTCGEIASPEMPGLIVRKRRERLGLSQQAMADRAGVRRQTVNLYEKPWGRPSRRYWRLTGDLVEIANLDQAWEEVDGSPSR